MPPAVIDRPIERTFPTVVTGVTRSDVDQEVAPLEPSAPITKSGEPAIFLVDAFYYELAAVDGEYVASEPQTGMYGEGDSASEAVVSLLGSLAALRSELRGRGAKLSPEHDADLRFLDRILWV